MLVDDRRSREAEFAEERRRRERELAAEREAREREVSQQMETMRRQMESLMDLVKESKKEGIEVPKSEWTYHLAPQLTGRAQQAFAALPGDNAGVYEELQVAILLRYTINEESYRRRFRETVRENGESNRAYVIRLLDLESKWKPETCVKAGEIADEFEQVRKAALELEVDGISIPVEVAVSDRRVYQYQYSWGEMCHNWLVCSENQWGRSCNLRRKGGSSEARAVGVTKGGQSYCTQAGARDPVGGTPWKGEDTSKNSETVLLAHNFQICGGILAVVAVHNVRNRLLGR
ncbi:hypothetical protein EMCRGX_G003294 [Ephydatia muelleri]